MNKAALSKITAPTLIQKKSQGEKITVLTAYDYTFAKIFDEAGVDCLLVGDSLGMTIQGRKNTLGVTLDHMLYHSHCVAKAASRAHVVCDLPFLSYQTSKEEAIRASGLALKKGKAEAVKMEGGSEIAELVAAVSALGIPVMGHIGLMPQYVQKMGGFKVQGKTKDSAKKILQDAKAIAAAGAYSIVVEGVPTDLAKKITDSIPIPTIGIGSGPHCDGQVLVCYDFLGMYPGGPKFVKKYANLAQTITKATQEYIKEVQEQSFPDEKYSY